MTNASIFWITVTTIFVLYCYYLWWKGDDSSSFKEGLIEFIQWTTGCFLCLLILIIIVGIVYYFNIFLNSL